MGWIEPAKLNTDEETQDKLISGDTSFDYWIDDEIPEWNQQYNDEQLSKFYVRVSIYYDENDTPHSVPIQIIQHPRWVYPNGSAVTDEYLFYNFSFRKIEYGPKPEFDNLNCKLKYRHVSEWTLLDQKCVPTYDIIQLSDEEKNYKIEKWQKRKRKFILENSKYFCMSSLYEITEEFKLWFDELLNLKYPNNLPKVPKNIYKNMDINISLFGEK